eukprot:jgi/Mesvir1/19305/Mv10374-RA.2
MAAISLSASTLAAPLASVARATSARATRGCQPRSSRPSAFLGNAGGVLLGSKKSQGLSNLLCAQGQTASPAQNRRMATVAMAGKGLPIDLTGKKCFIAGVADDQGFGWAIAKAMAEAGATIILGTWVPALNIFETSFRKGKFDDNRKLADGSMLDFAKIYPMDAVFDTPEDVPEEVKTNKRYAGAGAFTVQEVADAVKKDFGNIDIIVHSLANGPEVAKPLLETSRKGYLAANSASSYSFVSMVQRFGPIMNPGGAAVALTYLAGERVVPGYGGGMSSAKASLDSDVKVLAYEAGRKWNIRVNAVSAGECHHCFSICRRHFNQCFSSCHRHFNSRHRRCHHLRHRHDISVGFGSRK